MPELDGQVALVTGGGSGIGAAAARKLAALGARVVVADRNPEGAAGVAAEIGGVGVEVDVTDAASVDHMVEVAVGSAGRLDIAVNNAGVSGVYARVGDSKIDDWVDTIAVNLTGVYLCLRAELPHLLDGGGAVVNVASAAALMGVPGLAAYSASKHGVVGLTRSAALEYARKNVRINAVLPGTVRTPMLAAFAGSDDALEGMGQASPLGRLAEPDEIADAIVWLCSPTSSYVTGHTLAVDGGALAT